MGTILRASTLTCAQVLFYEDRPTVQNFQNQYVAYADRFPEWSTQSNAMHQFAVWTALETEGLGANLQHYNPLVDQKIEAEWNVSKDWELKAMLVFGTPVEGQAPGPKEHKDIGERFKVFGA